MRTCLNDPPRLEWYCTLPICSPSTKSIEMLSQMRWGIGRGCNNPAGDRAMILFRWHTGHSATNFLISAFIAVQHKLPVSRLKCKETRNGLPTCYCGTGVAGRELRLKSERLPVALCIATSPKGFSNAGVHPVPPASPSRFWITMDHFPLQSQSTVHPTAWRR